MPRGDIGFIPVAIDVDAVFAVLQYGEGGVRRIDFNRSSSSRWRTRKIIEPSDKRNCAVRSSSWRNVRLVSGPMRTEVEPMCNSARELRSVQRLSPVVSGRLGTAETQSPSPPG